MDRVFGLMAGLFLGGSAFGFFFVFLAVAAAAVMNQIKPITTSGIQPPSASKNVMARMFMFHADQLFGPSVGRATASRMAVSACTLRRR